MTSQDGVLRKERSATAWVMTIEGGRLSPSSVRCSEVRALDFDRLLMHFNEQTLLAVAANRWFGSPLARSTRMDRN